MLEGISTATEAGDRGEKLRLWGELRAMAATRAVCNVVGSVLLAILLR